MAKHKHKHKHQNQSAQPQYTWDDVYSPFSYDPLCPKCQKSDEVIEDELPGGSVVFYCTRDNTEFIATGEHHTVRTKKLGGLDPRKGTHKFGLGEMVELETTGGFPYV